MRRDGQHQRTTLRLDSTPITAMMQVVKIMTVIVGVVVEVAKEVEEDLREG